MRNSMLLFAVLFVPAVSLAQGDAARLKQACLEEILTADAGCLSDDKTMQLFRMVIQSLHSRDAHVLCEGYRDAALTPEDIWSMPAVCFADGEQRELWIEATPAPNDPALYFLDAAVSCANEGGGAATSIFEELYLESDGYFGEYAGGLLWKFLQNAEARSHDFTGYSFCLERMKEDLLYLTAREHVCMLLERYGTLRDSEFKRKMVGMLQEVLAEYGRIDG